MVAEGAELAVKEVLVDPESEGQLLRPKETTYLEALSFGLGIIVFLDLQDM